MPIHFASSVEDLVNVLQDAPVAQAAPADIQDLLGGALFKALYKWMQESGPVYLLPTGSTLTSLNSIFFWPFCTLACLHLLAQCC